jgi:hypothetical protein
MLFKETVAVYCESLYTPCGQNTHSSVIKEVVHIVTTGL